MPLGVMVMLTFGRARGKRQSPMGGGTFANGLIVSLL